MYAYNERARRSGRAAANDTGTMTAARYLTLRREAAGLSRAEVADRLCRMALRDPKRLHPAGKRPVPGEARALVDLLESRVARARFRQTIDALAAIYPLDVDVYFQLAFDPADRHPTVCSACGCTPADPCRGAAGVCTMEAHGGPCSRCIDGASAREAA